MPAPAAPTSPQSKALQPFARGHQDPGADRAAEEGTLLGISFDGLNVSGIVNELLHLAFVIRRRGFRVVIDHGFDIAPKAIGIDRRLLPSWVEPVRSFGEPLPSTYTESTMRAATAAVVAGTPIAGSRFHSISEQLAEALVSTLVRYDVDLLVVENGTLPDNPIATEAVYLAIAEYGARRPRGKFVLWRDWDLMWSSEPHRYGAYPFPGVHKPTASEHVEFAVSNEWMRRRMRSWAPGVDYHVVPSRFFAGEPLPSRQAFRDAFAIPGDDFLIARCTRVIPPKCVERDLRLLPLLQRQLDRGAGDRKVFLAVSGPTDEDPGEFSRLRKLQGELGLDRYVVWADGLLPFNPLLAATSTPSGSLSIRDLLSAADLSSFLTSFDYEGFGNPPGEAMAAGVPFAATTYELYHDVYGSRGAIAPLLPINRTSVPSDPIPEEFVDSIVYLLTDPIHRTQVIERNRSVVRRYFSLEALEEQVTQIFG